MTKPTLLELERRVICWHGTNYTNAQSILKSGFRRSTYFAAHLEDAICMGGPYVFAVWFPNDAPAWQFISSKAIPAERIQALDRFTVRHLRGEQLYKRAKEKKDAR